jgi:nucleoside permease NupC
MEMCRGLLATLNMPSISRLLSCAAYMLFIVCYSDETSVLDAATKGALTGIQLVFGIIANLIAFVSFIAFINGMLSWFGMLVGVEDLTLEVSYTALSSGINSSVFLRNKLLNLEQC